MLVILGIYTGCRIAELLGLCYDDVQGDQLRINKSLLEIAPPKTEKSKSKDDDAKPRTRVEISETKTLASIRTVPLSQFVLDEIAEHRKWHIAEQLKNGYRSDNIFTTSTGQLYFKSSIRTAFARLCKSVGVNPKGFHVFRHTYASRLAANGVPIQTLSKMLGHSNISVTSAYYVNVSDVEKHAALKALGL